MKTADKKYYSLEKNGQTATIRIYGDITSWPWESLGEVSANNLSKQLDTMNDVDNIEVYINSCGGEVAEGLAIYNALRRHKAKVTTICDGFACSIASVIFMAGDERIMNDASLLMIHNAWTYACGNSKELRKQADDLEKITQASVEAYKSHSKLSEEKIKELMDDETWILPSEAFSYGFATCLESSEQNDDSVNQSAWLQIFNLIKTYQEEKDNEDDEPDEGDNKDSTEPDDNSAGADNGNNDDDTEPDDDSNGDNKQSNTSDDDSDNKDNSEGDTEQKMLKFFDALLK